MSLAVTRLTEERKLWRKDHPFGFYARPCKNADGTLNLLRWECGIPGKPETPWEGGVYNLILHFPDSYPANPPKCINVSYGIGVFSTPLFHPNIFPSGSVCLSILGSDWKPSITVKQILIGIQDLLNEPNPKSPANDPAYQCFRKSMPDYINKVREQAVRFRPA